MSETQKIERYSPNTRWGKQRVRLTLMLWGYTATHEVDVGGNCLGFDVIEAGASMLLDQLPESDGLPSVVLKDGNGSELLSVDEEDRGERWLKSMIVGAEIIAWFPPTLNEVRAMNGAKPLPDGDKLWDAA